MPVFGSVAQQAARTPWPWWVWMVPVLASVLFVAVLWYTTRGVRWGGWPRESILYPEPVAPSAGMPTAPVATAPPVISAPVAAPRAAPPVASAPVAKPAQVPEAVVVDDADDLTKIEGIGPKIASTLIGAGIATFRQLAATSVADLTQILLDANLGLANVATWPEQAQLAADGNWEALAAMQQTLDGDKKV